MWFSYWYSVWVELEFGDVAFLGGKKTWVTVEKPSEQGENQQQTQPTWHRAGLKSGWHWKEETSNGLNWSCLHWSPLMETTLCQQHFTHAHDICMKIFLCIPETVFEKHQQCCSCNASHQKTTAPDIIFRNSCNYMYMQAQVPWVFFRNCEDYNSKKYCKLSVGQRSVLAKAQSNSRPTAL